MIFIFCCPTPYNGKALSATKKERGGNKQRVQESKLFLLEGQWEKVAFFIRLQPHTKQKVLFTVESHFILNFGYLCMNARNGKKAKIRVGMHKHKSKSSAKRQRALNFFSHHNILEHLGQHSGW